MKLRNLISSIAIALAIFSSCTDENIIEPTTSTAKVSIALQPSAIIMKAGDGTTQWATNEELSVNDCILAIFKGDDKVLVKYYGDLSEIGTSEVSTPLYRIEAGEIELDMNTPYHVMVIGNPGANLVSSYESCTTKAAFKEIWEGKDTYAFDPSNLLKFGELDATITEAANPVITVPLTQVAARINLRVTTELPGKTLVKGPYYESLDGKIELDSLVKTLTDAEIERLFPGAEKQQNISGESIKNGEFYYGNRKVTAGKMSNGYKGYKIPNYQAYKIHEYRKYVLEIKTLKIDNIRTRAIAVEPAQDENTYLIMGYEPTLNSLLGQYVFYTYERVDQTSSPLTVVISGDLYQANVKEKTLVTTDWWIFNAKNKVSLDYKGSDELSVETGWGFSETYFFAESKGDNWQEVEGGETIVDDGEKELKAVVDKLSFTIEPKKGIPETCHTDGVIHGNLYDVNAKMVKMPPIPTENSLDVEIKSYGTVNVDFGFN
ncbi:hypothetical protein [Parabacteroides sp. AM08-6]|uniref:hypothetical protein n=1 Tax=Parabacteroides sp. AM08-6 TaxID=2292053 RepID=UPI000EFE806A|nr:hypothetical protein [Parabacteroides sp. AM08-6]RHJ86443.1 hypothetical protein DW103_01825 [Parabacteroides sp. AM08-6]